MLWYLFLWTNMNSSSLLFAVSFGLLSSIRKKTTSTELSRLAQGSVVSFLFFLAGWSCQWWLTECVLVYRRRALSLSTLWTALRALCLRETVLWLAHSTPAALVTGNGDTHTHTHCFCWFSYSYLWSSYIFLCLLVLLPFPLIFFFFCSFPFSGLYFN